VEISIPALLAAGAHFGHLTSRWNPKMKPFLFGEREGTHLFDLEKTAELLANALAFLGKIRKSGRDVLFVGTKGQAQEAMRAAAEKSKSPFIVERWLGGTLTNFEEIKKRIRYFRQLEKAGTTDDFAKLTKKEQLMKMRELNKMRVNFEGLRDLEELPGALFVVDTVREKHAVREARLCGIPVVAIADSNADPDLIDLPIPMNDDSVAAIELTSSLAAEALGSSRPEKKPAAAAKNSGEKKAAPAKNSSASKKS